MFDIKCSADLSPVVDRATEARPLTNVEHGSPQVVHMITESRVVRVGRRYSWLVHTHQGHFFKVHTFFMRRTIQNISLVLQ